MKIGILGTGAMGAVYAVHFAAAGHEVWAIDSWAEHVAAMQAHGLRLDGFSGDRTVALNASTRAADAGVCDLVVIATKAAHVAAAAEAARGMLGPETPVLSIQNGLGGPACAADVLGSARILVGVAGGFGAAIKAPGHAHHNGMELIRLGEMVGPVTPRLEKTAEVWRSSGFKVQTFDDIEQLVWEKLICNVCYSGTSALTGLTVGQIMADEAAWSVASACAAEAYAVARAKNITLDFDDPVAYVRAFGEKIPGGKPSMLQDHLAARRSEIGVINGAIPREGAALGIPTPVNTLVSALITAKENGYAVKG